MLKSIILLNLLLSAPLYGMDIGLLFDKASKRLDKLLGNEKEVKDLITLPKIPEVKKNATSTDIYQKNYPIYKQGQSFKKLKLSEKRKYRVAFLDELYRVVRDEEVSDQTIKKYLNVLEQGGTREGVYRSLVLDRAYAGLEGYDLVASDQLVDFTVKYGETYLGRRFSPESLKKMNLWGIKRVLTEKTLEMLDVLAAKSMNVYRWYSVFSEDIALNYGPLMKSKLRKTNVKLTHYKWAQSVPFQHIKSEVIIKLHTVMNSLK